MRCSTRCWAVGNARRRCVWTTSRAKPPATPDRTSPIVTDAAGAAARLVAALDAAHPADALSERAFHVDASAIGPITAEDVRGALATTKPSAANQLERHERWSAEFGQTG